MNAMRHFALSTPNYLRGFDIRMRRSASRASKFEKPLSIGCCLPQKPPTTSVLITQNGYTLKRRERIHSSYRSISLLFTLLQDDYYVLTFNGRSIMLDARKL